MTQIKKFGLGAIAVALFAAMALATVSTASAEIATLTATNTTTGGISTVTATTGDGPVVFEILGTSTTTGATFLSTDATGGGTILECADGADCDTDAAADGDINVRIFVPSGSSAGTVNVRATDSDTPSDTETVAITVTSASGSATGVTLTGPSSILNGGSADITIYNTSASGARVAVTDVNVTVTRGTLAQDAVVGANRCVAIALDADAATSNDGTCLVNTVTSTTAPAKVGVYENGNIGENVVVNAFFNVNGVPTVAQHTMVIAGVAASATITAPTTIAAGANGQIVVNVRDAAGNPAPPTTVTVATSEGVVACPSTSSASGAVTCTFVAPGSAQTVVVTAVVDVPNSATDIVVSANIAVTGTATPGTPGTPGTCDGSLSTPNFGSGNVGSAVFDGCTIAQLSAAVTAAGGTAVWVQGTNGLWYRYNTLATGATAFVNNAFNAQFAAGLSQSAVFVVK